MAAYQARTLGAEAFHLGCLLAMLPAAVYATWAGWTGIALSVTLPSIPLRVSGAPAAIHARPDGQGQCGDGDAPGSG
jgi:hypothetical protein